MRPLRIGVIGAGGNTRKLHLPGFQRLPGVTVAAVANRTPESGARVAAEFGIPRVAGHWREIVEAPDVDAVCIGTWPYLHAELTIAALRAGKHVLTEARMARGLAEAEAMQAEALRHPGLVTQIVPAPMSLAYDAAVRSLLDSGRLGRLREIVLTHTTAAALDPATPLSWRQDFELSGKNTLTLGIFYEVVLRWLRREPEAVSASARILTPERRDESGRLRRVLIPDVLVLKADYADGMQLAGHFSAVEPAAPRSEIRLHGTNADLHLDFLAGQAVLTPAGGTAEALPAGGPGWNVEADFVASIREGRPVELTNFATGVAYMRFTESVWQSWNAGGARVPVRPA